MGKDTKISWATDTFSPWWGCTQVAQSGACDNCYAMTLSHRWGFDIWGKDKPRRFFGEKHWNDPMRWNKRATKDGVRRRVFCGSMCDVFEQREDLNPERAKLWKVIAQTPMLDWLLLTKRPALMTKYAPPEWKDGWPDNVWAGTTAEDQHWYDHRWPILQKVPAKIHWLSLEPLLGPIDLGLGQMTGKKPNWAIVGGESGHGARPMEYDWAISLKAQCADHGVAYFMKQKGVVLAKMLGCKDSKGGDPAEWPNELQIQNFPQMA